MKTLQKETVKYIYPVRDTKVAQWEASLKIDGMYNVLVREGYDKEHLDFIMHGKPLSMA